jgi:hypothetical protein
MIEKCSFGSMVIDGRRYTSDLKILTDGRVQDGWWRARGHRLTWEDIESLVDPKPDLLVVGAGIYGRMKPAPGLVQRLADEGIEAVVAWSKNAAEAYNDARQRGIKTAACFHLTC